MSESHSLGGATSSETLSFETNEGAAIRHALTRLEMSFALADEGSMAVNWRHGSGVVRRHEHERYATHRQRVGYRKAGLGSEIYVQTGDVDCLLFHRLQGNGYRWGDGDHVGAGVGQHVFQCQRQQIRVLDNQDLLALHAAFPHTTLRWRV